MNSLEAVDALLEDAEQIRKIILKQRHYLCLSKCKAFEEVIDTQLYGFSCKIDFAIKIGLIDKKQGKEILLSLENDLDTLYDNIQGEEGSDETIK